MMFRRFIILLVFCTGVATLVAEEFHPPAAYPVDRYEPMWNKNPFTLKTAPVALQKESFARDLALAGITKIGEDTTVLLVNTKTREYLRLKNLDAHTSGMKVKSVNMRDTRSDSSVEVVMGAESSVLKYDDGFLKQMAAQVPVHAAVANNNGAPPVTGVPGSNMPPLVAVGGAPPPPPGGMINQAGVAKVPPIPVPNNRSPMTNAPQNNIPTVPTRRVRTAPVPRPSSPAPNP